MTPSRTFFRKLIVGHNEFILSHKRYKRILLTGQLCLITFIVCCGYLILDISNKISYSWPFQSACAALALLSFLLNRHGKFTAAKILLGLSVNLTVFIFSINEPSAVGMYMYFIVCNLGALITFGYEERYKALGFVLFSTSLFLLSLFIHTDFIPRPAYSPDYMLINVIINFFGASLSSFVLASFLINVNHRAEEQMEKREIELAQANALLTKVNTELDRFVYSSSHDLRAPLHSIQGLIQLTHHTNDPVELREYIELMKGRVTNLEKFILDMANYARNSRQPHVQETISIKRAVLDSLDSLRFFPGAEKIKIFTQIPEELVMTTDVSRLQIVLNNLISNALKYQDEKKDHKFIRIYVESRGDTIIFTIEDNGIGIPHELLDKIFQMYSRLHEQSFGSGLGLYIVKETIEKLAGSIQVRSSVGVGSTFIVELPNRAKVKKEIDLLIDSPGR